MKTALLTALMAITFPALAQTAAEQQREFERREFMDQQRLHNERVNDYMHQQQQRNQQIPFVMSGPDIGGAIQRGVDMYNAQQRKRQGED